MALPKRRKTFKKGDPESSVLDHEYMNSIEERLARLENLRTSPPLTMQSTPYGIALGANIPPPATIIEKGFFAADNLNEFISMTSDIVHYAPFSHRVLRNKGRIFRRISDTEIKCLKTAEYLLLWSFSGGFVSSGAITQTISAKVANQTTVVPGGQWGTNVFISNTANYIHSGTAPGVIGASTTAFSVQAIEEEDIMRMEVTPTGAATNQGQVTLSQIVIMELGEIDVWNSSSSSSSSSGAATSSSGIGPASTGL
jgi:hypothetical protein